MYQTKQCLGFNYLGFKPQEVKVGSDINFNIQLKEDAVSTDEVVVVGYGNQKNFRSLALFRQLIQEISRWVLLVQ